MPQRRTEAGIQNWMSVRIALTVLVGFLGAMGSTFRR